MCIGRVLPFPISKSTDTFWQTPTEITFATNSVIGCDRAVVFCSLSWQDTYWDPYPRHDYVRALISMALNLITFYVVCDIGVFTYICTSTTTHLCTPEFTYVGVTCDTFLASYIIVFKGSCKKVLAYWNYVRQYQIPNLMLFNKLEKGCMNSTIVRIFDTVQRIFEGLLYETF